MFFIVIFKHQDQKKRKFTYAIKKTLEQDSDHIHKKETNTFASSE
jgi:hypothetical protein